MMMNFREWLNLDESTSTTRQRGSGYTPEPSLYGSSNSQVGGLTSFQAKLKAGNLTQLVSRSMPGNHAWTHSADPDDNRGDVIALQHQPIHYYNIDKDQVMSIPTRWGKPSSPIPDKPWWKENQSST